MRSDRARRPHLPLAGGDSFGPPDGRRSHERAGDVCNVGVVGAHEPVYRDGGRRTRCAVATSLRDLEVPDGGRRGECCGSVLR